nr:hypothetical protein [bacterium]
HQIRVHLHEIGLSILNDFKYGQGANKTVRNYLKRGILSGLPAEWQDVDLTSATRLGLFELLNNYNGIFLHAAELRFQHPASDSTMQFTSRPPEIWDEVRELFGQLV